MFLSSALFILVPLSVWACVCVLEKRERRKEKISLHLVYCSTPDVVLSGFFYNIVVAATVFSLGTAAVCSGKQYEFNLHWRRSLVSRVWWCSAGTRERHWSSWIHLEDCWGSKHTWHERVEVDVNKRSTGAKTSCLLVLTLDSTPPMMQPDNV